MAGARLSICCTYFLLSWFPVHAQDQPGTRQVKMPMLTINDGLSQGWVNDGMQDKEGFIWLATPDGLNRYDGYEFKVYRNVPGDSFSLPVNHINCIAEDDNGNFWVGTSWKGLYLFDRKKDRFYPVPFFSDSMSAKGASVIFLRCQNKKLFVGFPRVMFVLDISSITDEDYSTDSLSKKAKPMASCSVATAAQPIAYYFLYPDNSIEAMSIDFEQVSFFNPNPGATTWAVQQLNLTDLGVVPKFPHIFVYRYPGKNIYCVADTTQLWVYDATEKKIRFKQTLPAPVTEATPRFDSGKLLFCLGLEKALLVNFDLTSFRLSIIQPEKDTRLHKVLFKDRTGMFWIATNADGLALYDPRKLAFQKTFGNGRLVIGTNRIITELDSKIYEFNLSTARLRMIAGTEEFNPISAIYLWEYLDNRGRIWRTGEGNSVIAYDTLSRKTSKVAILPESRSAYQEISGVFQDTNGSLWFEISDHATNKGSIQELNSESLMPGRRIHFPVTFEDKGNTFFSSHLEDENGIHWFATLMGLFRLDMKQKNEKEQWKHWVNVPGDSTSIPSNFLNGMCADPKEPNRYLWVSTRGAGFFRLDKESGRCVRYSTKDGLPNDYAMEIQSDETGNLWISTNRGLSCFTPPTGEFPKGRFRNFTEADGLAGNEFDVNGSRKTSDGYLYFVGVKGNNWFKPAEVLTHEGPVPVRFTLLQVNNEPASFTTHSQILNEDIAYSTEITLTPDVRVVTIGFSALDFRNKEHLQYKYYLEGFDESWSHADRRNEITYTNLSPKRYTLRVLACNSDGVWGKEEASMVITVLPAWWQTMWFKILVILLAGGSIYAFYRYRLHQKLKLLTIRNKIAGDLHDEIGSTLSSISLSSAIIQKKLNHHDSEVSPLLKQISSNTDEMMEAMSDIVWSINTKNDRFNLVHDRMRAYAIEMTEAKNILLTMEVDERAEQAHLEMVKRKNLYLIFKEAVNNAAKYSGCSNLWIMISLEGNKKLSMVIKDDGKGFSAGSNGDRKWAASRGGNGIENMKKRAAEINGVLEIDSSPEKGTALSLTFPL
ncbi:MAG: hypothetical protein K1X63_07545 [Chitinophagales bacterium]|nr:hypothetical protein [Chitinophagales bacterium]